MLNRAVAVAFCIALSARMAAPAMAQSTEDDDGPAIGTEEPDPTRLDVERLPPEAIRVTRDLYAHGFFVEAQLGGLGFVNGIGDIVDGGPWAVLSFGYEILDWLHVLVSAEGSMHNTSAPPPPARQAFAILGGSASLRLQGNFTEAFAMWLSAQFAVLAAMTDVLSLYGYQDAADMGIAYGGEVGADWHFRARHHSIGLVAGVRHYPSLESVLGDGPALGIHGSAYLRYVF